MKCNKIFCVLLGLVLWAGCNKEDDLTPLGVEEPFLTLPQGDNDYDDRIMQLYDDYGVSIFYKFNPQDIYFGWTSGEWSETSVELDSVVSEYTYIDDVEDGYLDYTDYFTINESGDSVAVWSWGDFVGNFAIGTSYYTDTLTTGETYELPMVVTVEQDVEGNPYLMKLRRDLIEYVDGTFSVECADPNYINKQLDLLETMLFKNYSEEMLKLGMPPRIMLGKGLIVSSEGESLSASYVSANNNFILSHGDASIEALTGDALWSLKTGFNEWFLADGMAEELYEDVLNTTDFFSITEDYSSLVVGTNVGNQRKLITEEGLCLFYLTTAELASLGSSSVTLEEKQKLDLKSFLAMVVSFPEEYLTVDVKPVGTYSTLTGALAAYTLTDPKGRLSSHTDQDESGKIREKYDIIVEYLTGIGVNVAEVSNAYWDQQTSYE